LEGISIISQSVALPHGMDVIVMLQNNISTCNKILKQFNNVDVWIGENYVFAALSQREQFIVKQSRGS
jgi:hypothetical protein